MRFNIQEVGGVGEGGKPCCGSTNEITPFSCKHSITAKESSVWKVAQPFQNQHRGPDNALMQNLQKGPKFVRWDDGIYCRAAEPHTLPPLVLRLLLGSVNMQSRAALEHSQNIYSRERKKKKIGGKIRLSHPALIYICGNEGQTRKII